MKFDPVGRNIFQILISDVSNQDLDENPTLSINRRSFRELYPEFSYSLLDDGDLRELLRSEFSELVLKSYDMLVPYAYKADLARYCLLYAFGGIYADLSMRLFSRFTRPPGKELVCFRDAYVNGGSTWAVSNGLIYAAPRRPEMMTAINLIVENCQARYYGASLLHPTGPALFGRAIAIVDRGEELEVGDFRNLTATAHPLSYGYVDGSGKLTCIRMKEHGGDLALVGVKGMNMYDAVWRLRAIYGEPISFDHSDQRLRLLQGSRDQDGIMITRDLSGCVIFGPYVYLTAGRYRGKYSFHDEFQTTGITLDVVRDNLIIAEVGFARLDDDDCVSLEFTLPLLCTNLQVRLSVQPGSKGWCTGLQIIRL